MGTITTSGVGSGIDIEGLVTRLVQAEGTPKRNQLQAQQASVQARLSAYGQVRSALAQLQSAAATLKETAIFRSRSTTVGDADVLAAGAGSAAAPGTYAVEVVRLAQGAKLASAPYAASSTAVGTGTLTLSTGGKSFAVAIDGTNNTLAGIRDAINRATDNPGVAATLVTANDGVRLVLSSSVTGAASAITVAQAGGDGGLAALTYDPAGSANGLTSLQAARDARIVVDGFTYDSPSNTVTGALEGVTLTLKKESAAGVTTPLTVTVDNAKAQGAISAFVTAYNQVVQGLRALGAYDPAGRQGGPLVGDSLLRGVLSSVRTQLGSPSAALAGNAYTSLSDVGITTNLDGTLKIDGTKLSSALGNSAALQRLFTDDGGVAKRLDALLTDYTKAGGLIDSRTGGLQSTLKDIDARRVALDAQMTAYERRVRAQFTAMDTLVAQLRQTGQALTSQLSSIDPNYLAGR
jgi:flagellar hook-associated protein 2